MGEGFAWYKSLLSFSYDLYHYDDRHVRNICGTDVVLYLIFLRYSAILFGIISLVNIVLLILYYTADDNEHYTILQRLTVLNNLKNYYLMWIVFFLTIVFSMFGHMLLHLLEEKRRQ